MKKERHRRGGEQPGRPGTSGKPSLLQGLLQYWYALPILLFLTGAALLYVIFGEGSYIAVHDNLDLFVAQMQMMKHTGSFFAQGAEVPFLGGISRDNLPSEWSLYTLLYMILPAFPAYVTGYFVKIGVAILSVWLLARDWYGEAFYRYRPLAAWFGFTYGILNLFPAFGIAFASIPLVIWLLRGIYRQPSWKWYVGLFFYPVLSYFSYFGFFILAYLTAGILWLWIRDRRWSRSLTGALFVLGAGYVVLEYRLFGMMLLGEEVTIRSTMVEADLRAGEVLFQILDVWMHGMFHAESLHHYLVWWVCMGYFAVYNLLRIRRGRWREIFHDSYNLLILLTVFNSLIYGLYYWGDFRRLIAALIPQLEGFQFNRTIFFNPFLWYGAFFMVLQRIYDLAAGYQDRTVEMRRKEIMHKEIMHKGIMRLLLQGTVYGLALLAAGIILVSPTRYNDLWMTARSKAVEILKGKKADAFSYEEFYSEAVFEELKQQLDYQGEWAVAYGFHPAVLEYNGIATLDGYLGFYAQSYKEAFRKIIAPALEQVEASRIYYDDWGARAYLYSGAEDSVISTYKSWQPADYRLTIDPEAFRELEGYYIFSRIPLENAAELGMELAAEATGEAYTVYVYAWSER